MTAEIIKSKASLAEDALHAAQDEDWLAAVHLGVFATIADVADQHHAEYEAEERAAYRRRVEKAKRAVLKAYLVSKHKPGQHDQDDHGNWADSDHNEPRMKTRIKGDAKTREYDAAGDLSDLTYGIARLLKLPERIAEKSAHNTQHMTEWLKEKKWGEKILMGAGFLGKSNPTVGTAAAAATVLQGLKDNPEARKAAKKYYLRYGGLEYASPGIKRGVGDRGAPLGSEKDKAFRNRVYAELAHGIPDDNVARLSRATGSFPPSEGVIIGGKRVQRKDGTTLYGDAVVRALGKGGDNYLPFSAKHMAKSRDGGWLLRRRTWGGPTAEDLHISMAFGAKGAGVVSRHGIYEVSWNDQYLGSKGRYGIEHKRILSRYNELLGQVAQGGVRDPKNPNKRMTLNHEGYSLALDALKAEFPWYIESVRHERADKTQKYNGGESGAAAGGGFFIWKQGIQADDGEIDYSAKVTRKKADGRKDYEDIWETATQQAPGFGGGQQPRPVGGGIGMSDEQRAARDRGMNVDQYRQWRQNQQRQQQGQGQSQRAYDPRTQVRDRINEEQDPANIARSFLQSADVERILRQASPREREIITNAALSDEGDVNFEAVSILKDVVDRSTNDRYDNERDYDEPDASDLLRIEQEEEDRARIERERRGRDGRD